MSIGSAINNALSGLNSFSRAASVVANNTANVMTEDYTRRSVEFRAHNLAPFGTGVQIGSVSRRTDVQATEVRRAGDGDNAAAQYAAGELRQIAELMGSPGETHGIVNRVTALETALESSAALPSSDVRLTVLKDAAASLADEFKKAADTIQRLRGDADAGIHKSVQSVNDLLHKIDALNENIASARSRGGDALSLQDERQAYLDDLGRFMRIAVISRDHDQVAIFTPGGATLLDSGVRELKFSPTPVINETMSLSGGRLSTVTIEGQPSALSAPELFAGGTIEAMLALRDVDAVEAADKLDALAADIVTRFQNDLDDPTRGPSDAGLFTDAGSRFATSHELGLAARISLNAEVDPSRGGQLFRLRSGINAGSPSPIGDAGLLNAMSAAMSAGKSSSLSDGRLLDARGMAEHLASDFHAIQAKAEGNAARMGARSAQLRKDESAATSVNTDKEAQLILQIEKAYLANSKVFSIADDMLRRLLEI